MKNNSKILFTRQTILPLGFCIILDKNGTIAIDWGVYGIPETFIVDKKGVIKYRQAVPISEKIYKKINLIINEIEKWYTKNFLLLE